MDLTKEIPIRIYFLSVSDKNTNVKILWERCKLLLGKITNKFIDQWLKAKTCFYLSYIIFTSRVSGRGNIIGPVCVCVCLSVCILMAKPFDLRPWFLACWLTLTPGRMGLKVKVIGQRSRSNIKIVFYSLLSEMRSKVKVNKVKVKGQVWRS